jgi:hypothetical protein
MKSLTRKGLDVGGWMDDGKRKEHTVHQRKYDIDYPAVPLTEGADPILIEREVGKYHHFR